MGGISWVFDQERSHVILEVLTDEEGNYVLEEDVKRSPPWWWGVENQTEPTAPLWGKE